MTVIIELAHPPPERCCVDDERCCVDDVGKRASYRNVGGMADVPGRQLFYRSLALWGNALLQDWTAQVKLCLSTQDAGLPL
jgi:hypothetical protein